MIQATASAGAVLIAGCTDFGSDDGSMEDDSSMEENDSSMEDDGSMDEDDEG